tara:strand:+ start:4917 stop:5783 length:867 start_codon:yes stop_codon:yes gene_type:complete
MSSIVTKENKINGFNTFWTLTNSDKLILQEGFKELGIDSLIPDPRIDTQALNRALSLVFRGRDYTIKTVKGTSGYIICGREDLGDGRRRYTEALRVTFKSSTSGEPVSLEYEHGSEDTSIQVHSWTLHQIEDEFRRQEGIIPANTLGTVLSKVARKERGVSMRPRGGMYWLPEDKREFWEKVAEVVNKANSDNTISIMETIVNKNSLSAIRSGLIRQVTSGLKQLEEGIEDGELGKRALKSRKNAAEELDDLIETYSEILNDTLSDLRDHQSQVDDRVAMALWEAVSA